MISVIGGRISQSMWGFPVAVVPISTANVIAVAAHDITNDLTVIHGATQELIALLPDDHEARPALLALQTAVDSLGKQAKQLRDYASRHGARPTNKSLAKTIEDARDT